MNTRIRSSWNADRVAAAAVARKPAKRGTQYRAQLYTQYRCGGNMVAVYTRRGRKVYDLKFDSAVVSASVSDNVLVVETASGSHFRCEAWNGRLLDAQIQPAAAAAQVLGSGIEFAA